MDILKGFSNSSLLLIIAVLITLVGLLWAGLLASIKNILSEINRKLEVLFTQDKEKEKRIDELESEVKAMKELCKERHKGGI